MPLLVEDWLKIKKLYLARVAFFLIFNSRLIVVVIMEQRNNIETRLIDFAVSVLNLSESLPNSRGSIHLAGQLVRSGTAPALQYGEAQGAESRRDFIHKMKIALKELRETSICLQILHRKNYLKSNDSLTKTLQENNELISIFVSSINTATRNLKAEVHRENNA